MQLSTAGQHSSGMLEVPKAPPSRRAGISYPIILSGFSRAKQKWKSDLLGEVVCLMIKPFQANGIERLIEKKQMFGRNIVAHVAIDIRNRDELSGR